MHAIHYVVHFNDFQLHNWTEKLDPATRKVTPRPFLILAAWEPPKPIHFWKGHRKSGRIGLVKIFPHPLYHFKGNYGNQWDYLFSDLMTLGGTGRGGNAFLGCPSVGTKYAFPPVPVPPRVIRSLNK